MPFVRRPRPGVTTSSAKATEDDTPNAAPGSNQAGNPAPTAYGGTRPTPTGPVVSSGIGSLDDLLGGGQPLGSTLLLLAPDMHTQWSRLVARHAAAAGLLDGQRVLVIANDEDRARTWAAGMPWVDEKAGADSESEGEGVEGGGRKIAWRYEGLGKFRTTVGSSRLMANLSLPAATRTELERDGALRYAAGADVEGILGAVAAITETDRVTRVLLPDLGGAEAPLSAADIHRVLLGVRALIRTKPVVGIITLPPRLSSSPPSPSETTSGDWISSLAWSADACLTFAGFGSAPQLAAAYYPAHGLLTPHSLPKTASLLPPALRYSSLLGVSSGREQNLGFRLKRKKFVVESVHLGIEGGTSERRTEPVQTAAPRLGGMSGLDVHPGIVGGIEPAAVILPEVEIGRLAISTVEKKKKSVRVRFGEEEIPAAPKRKTSVHFNDDQADPAPSARHHSLSPPRSPEVLMPEGRARGGASRSALHHPTSPPRSPGSHAHFGTAQIDPTQSARHHALLPRSPLSPSGDGAEEPMLGLELPRAEKHAHFALDQTDPLASAHDHSLSHSHSVSVSSHSVTYSSTSHSQVTLDPVAHKHAHFAADVLDPPASAHDHSLAHPHPSHPHPSHSHPHSHPHPQHRVEIDHDRPDLYEF